MSHDAERWAWLEERQRFGMHPGLERTRELLAALGHPERRFEVVLVAGTNGKGSVTAMLHAMLRAAGRDAARFTSPHLERFEERFVVAGDEHDAARLAAAADRAREPVVAIGATYFEALTAIALDAFAAAGVDTAVLEVGMGGRWDATNATEPVLSLVTAVDLDHVAVLGSTVEQIAADKAGVARRGRPLLCGASGAALEVVRAEVDGVGGHLWALDDVDWTAFDHGWRGVGVRVAVPGGETWRLESHLLGAHQARNLALAAAAAAALGAPEWAAREGARAVQWPGRLEPIDAFGRRWLLDGAHNPAGAAALAAAIRVLAPAGAAALIVGVSADKDVDGVLRALPVVTRRVVVTRSVANVRAEAPERLGERARSLAPATEVDVAPDPEAALRAAIAGTDEGDLVLVAGSLFLIGEVRTLLRGGRPSPATRWQ